MFCLCIRFIIFVSSFIEPVQHALNTLEVGSMVQFDNPPQYGYIKWIGILPGYDTEYAGVETVSKYDQIFL